MKVNWNEWKENIVGDSFFYFDINDGRRVVALISGVQEGDEVYQIVTVDDLDGNVVYRGRPEAFEAWFEDATSGAR